MSSGVIKAGAKAISEVANNIRNLSDDETIDEILKAIRRTEPLPKEDAIPQYRGAHHQLDPDYVSMYTGRASTFTSSDPDFALNYGLGARAEETSYFHKFEDLKEDEVFDIMKPEAGAVLKWANRHLTEDYDKEDLLSSIKQATETGHWATVEGMMHMGYMDNLPDNYKAVRIRGESDNYVYIGRQIPRLSQVEVLTVPSRKHFVGVLGEVNNFIADYSNVKHSDKLKAMQLKEFRALQDSWAKEKKTLVGNSPRQYIETVDKLFENLAGEMEQAKPMMNYYSANVFGATDTATKENIKHILSSVDTKAEAKDLLKALIVGPKLRIDTVKAKKDLAITGSILKKLDSVPDKDFNMLKFIKDNNLYSVVLPALGIGTAMQDEDETDSALQELRQ